MADVKAPALSPALIRQAEFVRNVWSVEVPPGIALASVQDPSFWAHCSKSLKPYDKIECRAQDNAWYAEMLVAKVEKQAARMWTIVYADLRAQAERTVAADEYSVSFGGAHKWRVVRVSDKEVIHHGEASAADANAWLAQFLVGKVSA